MVSVQRLRTWAAETSGFKREIAEAALAHAVSNDILRAYQRTSFFDRRARLMAEWSKYCAAPPVAAAGPKVVKLRA